MDEDKFEQVDELLEQMGHVKGRLKDLDENKHWLNSKDFSLEMVRYHWVGDHQTSKERKFYHGLMPELARARIVEGIDLYRKHVEEQIEQEKKKLLEHLAKL